LLVVGSSGRSARLACTAPAIIPPGCPGRVPWFKHQVRSLSAAAAARRRCCSEGRARRRRRRCRHAVPAMAGRDALRRPSRRHRIVSRCVPAWRGQEGERLPSLGSGPSSWWSRLDRDYRPNRNIGWAGHRRTRLQSCRSLECSGASRLPVSVKDHLDRHAPDRGFRNSENHACLNFGSRCARFS
jgi:hypothetical protein